MSIPKTDPKVKQNLLIHSDNPKQEALADKYRPMPQGSIYPKFQPAVTRRGMRINEVLPFTPSDIEDRKLTLRNPQSGEERKVVFSPQKIARLLRESIDAKGIGSDRWFFPIS
jgi:hypothetical protein